MNLTKYRLFVWAAATTLGAGMLCSAPTFSAQTQAPDRGEQQQPEQKQGDQQQGQAQSKTYVGQVIQAQNGQYALLTDKSAGRGYFLDDQTKAKKFNGQNVKVTGTVDAQTKTLHIAEIQSLPQ